MADRRYKLINGGLTATEKSDIEAADLDLSGSVTLGGNTIQTHKRQWSNINGGHTLAEGEEGYYLELRNTTAMTLTIPAGLTWEAGAEVYITRSSNSGVITLSPATGVRIRGRENGATFDVTATTQAITATYKGWLGKLVQRQGFTDEWYFYELTV